MIVRLKRNFFLGGTLFEASRFGVEIPDEVDGKPVIPFDGKAKGEAWRLPQDAVVMSAPLVAPNAKDQVQALSTLSSAGASQSFVKAMASEADDDI